jgi:hypothetical protein
VVSSGGSQLLHHHLFGFGGAPRRHHIMNTISPVEDRKMPAAMACSLLRTVH